MCALTRRLLRCLPGLLSARRNAAGLLAIVALPFGTALSAELAEAAQDVALNTNLGTVVLELDDERAPATVRNFLQYVDDDFYDGTIFHRVIDGFMVQGGGFDADYRRKPVREPIVNEADNGLRNARYTIAMARTNAPHSATSQFFINTENNDNLDHTSPSPRGWGYAVFGRVVEGQDVVDAISEVETGAGGPFSRDAPRKPVIIESAVRLDEQTGESDASVNDEPPVGAVRGAEDSSDGTGDAESARGDDEDGGKTN